MADKISVQFDKGSFSRIYNVILTNWFYGMSLRIDDVIIKQMQQGKSPVKGHKWDKYSESYKKAIRAGRYPGKTIRPVNLKLTEKLHKSIKVRKLKDNRFSILFTDPKFKYHQYGKGKMPVRKILPTSPSEQFNRAIEREMENITAKAIEKAFK